MGHSIGGAICFIYAGAYPDGVEYLINLEIACPSIISPDTMVDLYPKQMNDMVRRQTATTKSYEYKEILRIMQDAYSGVLSDSNIKTLLLRGIKSANGDRWIKTLDPRLKVGYSIVFVK